MSLVAKMFMQISCSLTETFLFYNDRKGCRFFLKERSILKAMRSLHHYSTNKGRSLQKWTCNSACSYVRVKCVNHVVVK